tara:strand:+ start:208 stop:702 length:495 start_codon:yes stop_codon:yes gene_type:complete
MWLGKNHPHLIAWLIIILIFGCTGTVDTERELEVKYRLSEITANSPTSHIELLFYERFNQINQNSDETNNFRLDYSLIVSNSQTLTIRQNSSNLKHTSVTVEFKLIESQNGKIIHAGKISSEATSGAVSSLYGQAQSSKFAQERLAILLAQRVYQNLYLFFLEN